MLRLNLIRDFPGLHDRCKRSAKRLSTTVWVVPVPKMNLKLSLEGRKGGLFEVFTREQFAKRPRRLHFWSLALMMNNEVPKAREALQPGLRPPITGPRRHYKRPLRPTWRFAHGRVFYHLPVVPDGRGFGQIKFDRRGRIS
jgi:hypothetical protein